MDGLTQQGPFVPFRVLFAESSHGKLAALPHRLVTLGPSWSMRTDKTCSKSG